MFDFWRKSKPEEKIPEVNSQQDCDALFADGCAILFKHSPSCPLSWAAHRQIMHFRKTWPDAPVHLVSVQRQRALSVYIAERTGVRHESPQVLVLSEGKVRATASHADITAELLTTAWCRSKPIASNVSYSLESETQHDLKPKI